MIKKLYIFGAFLTFFFLLLPPAQAQKILEDLKKAMPDIAFLTEEEWPSDSKLHKEESRTERGESDIVFEVRLPQDWEVATDAGLSTFKNEDAVFGEIGRFYGPARLVGTRSHMTVQSIRRMFQLTSEQWFLEYLLKRGYNVQGFKAHDENRVEALYVVLENQVSYIVRGVSIVSGNSIILAEYFLPIEYWKQERAAQNSIMASFAVKDAGDDVVEELSNYMFLDIVEVLYPSSWKLRSSPIRSIDHMDVELLNLSSQKTTENKLALNGKIDVALKSIYSTPSLIEEIEKIKSDVLSEGLKVGDYLQPVDLEVHDMFEFQSAEVFSVSDVEQNISEYELWFSVLRAGDYYYFISLLSLSRDEDYYAWTRNTQTFKLINEKLRPLEKSLTGR